jgi:hypothetical protein
LSNYHRPFQVSNGQHTDEDKRGTEKDPLVVKLLVTPKSAEQVANDKQERDEKAWSDTWLISLTGFLGLVGIIQAGVFWLQARRLRQSVELMSDQSADTKLSIAQATRAALAMEGVAAGIEETVKTNKTVLDNQRDFWSRQLRAYISVDIGIYRRQNNKLRFEFRPVPANNGNILGNNVRVLSKC